MSTTSSRKSQEAAGRQDSSQEDLRCPVCWQPYKVEQFICLSCGATLPRGKGTRPVNTDDVLPEPSQPPGATLVPGKDGITFEIGSHWLPIPAGERVIVGRKTDDPEELHPPDIDLSPFGADEKGVSRRHLQISYKGDLIVVTDLGSKNGTWLNDQRLLPRIGKPLHDGDHLRLGLLQVNVRFC